MVIDTCILLPNFGCIYGKLRFWYTRIIVFAWIFHKIIGCCRVISIVILANEYRGSNNRYIVYRVIEFWLNFWRGYVRLLRYHVSRFWEMLDDGVMSSDFISESTRRFSFALFCFNKLIEILFMGHNLIQNTYKTNIVRLINSLILSSKFL